MPVGFIYIKLKKKVGKMISLERWKNWDGFGVAASMVCILHCLFLPILLGLLPALSLNFLSHNPSVHLVLFLIMMILAIGAFLIRYPIHKKWTPAVLLLLGLVVVGYGQISLYEHHNQYPPGVMMCSSVTQSYGSTSVFFRQTPFSTWITVLGGLILILGHYYNRKSLSYSCYNKMFF